MTYLTLLGDLIARYHKAVWAFLLPAAGVVSPDLLNGNWPSGKEWLAALALAVFTAGGVSVAKNRGSGSENVG